jgi:hypothetical protein
VRQQQQQVMPPAPPMCHQRSQQPLPPFWQ